MCPPRVRRILVIDDEPLIARLIADTLVSEGYEVDTAANGREGLEKIADHAYDLIMSDLRMPELDGLAFYREVGRRRPDLAARIVFVSGTTDLPEYTEFLQQTSVPVLSKPFHVEMLLRFVKQCLQVLG
ncbi:MAG TPA: response regulator [Methylomirabilota bacterium]|nr:response regulator [Methylomirabilota bacterium]